MTSGGSEANLAGIWWCKLYLTMVSRPLINQLKSELQAHEERVDHKQIYLAQKALKRLYSPILVCTAPPYTHQSVIKAAQVLELKTLYVHPNQDGSMDTNSLRGKLAEL